MPIKRLLIVDDEGDLIRPLYLRLTSLGPWKVAVAGDGAEGLVTAVEFRPDIALIDLAMPVMDGWALCRKLREDPRTRETRLVVMTAWISEDLGQRALAEGVAEVLVKPFEEAALLKAIGAM